MLLSPALDVTSTDPHDLTDSHSGWTWDMNQVWTRESGVDQRICAEA